MRIALSSRSISNALRGRGRSNRRTIATGRLVLAGAVALTFLGTAWAWVTQSVAEPESPPVRAAGADASTDAIAARQNTAEAPDEEAADGAISTVFVRPDFRSWTSADLPQANGVSPRTNTRVPVRLEDRLSPGRSAASGRSDYIAIIARQAALAGVPRELVQAVMAVESRFDPTAVGADGEIGLMQIMPGTARMLGFTGSLAELADAEINIAYGTAYLAGAWRLANQDICTAAMKYRAGHGESRFSFLSVEYCIRVRAELVALGFPVTGSVPQATFGQPGGPRGRSAVGRSVAQLDFRELNAQLRQSTDRMVLRPK
ncbi:MAG: lytic transglycosylase domain-containing protein [Bradyrhizobium sp.]|nr:lytic transglycosylase domain-containing protein [Bradyrhizobium sp.]